MTSTKTVGVLLFERFELLDVFGPLEAWGMLAVESRAFRIVMTAADAGPVASAQGPRAVADHALEDCPPVDILLVPGGMGTRRVVHDGPVLDWLRRRAEKAEMVTSVCTGAGLLARAGLLDGKSATTNKRSFAWVMEQGPAVNWVKQARWVEDGRFVTSSGVSAGIDMTLAVIARLTTTKTADDICERMEYERHADASWDPFAKVHGLV